MSFSYRPAVLDKTSVLIGLAGPTGCGKTYSALRFATGLAGKTGKIGFVDTEAGRGLHYARKFNFHHGILAPPFDPEAYAQAVEQYEKDGFDVIIVDSMSHEYAGEGGIQDWADRLESGGMKSPLNWSEPKSAHKRMVNRFLQCRAHLIFCLRAEEKIKVEMVNGKRIVVPVGFKPICEKNFMYEQTASFMMTDTAPGVPQPIKLQDQHKEAFPDAQRIDEEAGKKLAAWSNSGAAKLESKARTLPLVAGDGEIRVISSAPEWLSGFDRELREAENVPPVFAKLWENNSDVFYKIEKAARGRNDAAMKDTVNTIGAFALARIGTTGEEIE